MTPLIMLSAYCLLGSLKVTPAYIHFQPSLENQGMGFWKVEKELIPIIQERLKFYVHEQVGADHAIIKDWKGYRFQIVGTTPYKGKKEILINAFCARHLESETVSISRDKPFDPQTDWVSVDDGGSCFFSVTMDPTTLAFTSYCCYAFPK